jgi:hypothetical protein
MAETQLLTIIADIPDRITRDFLGIDGVEVMAGDLAQIDDHVKTGHGFAGHAAARVLLHAGIQDGVRYLVTQFVGMPFAYGFRSEYMRSVDLAHECPFPW